MYPRCGEVWQVVTSISGLWLKGFIFTKRSEECVEGNFVT